MKKKRSKVKKKEYFTQVHEDAIIEYALTSDIKRRNDLYVELIQPVFDELVDKIVYTYRFTSLPNIEDLKLECKVWLTTILNKFDASKGSKAFSYFSVITKNWFIHKVKRYSYERNRILQYNDLPKKIEEEYLSHENEYHEAREQREYWQALWGEIRDWEAIPMKSNETKVYEAIKILLKNPDDIEIFNKKAIYLYLRELTGLSTKQVVSSLKRMRSKYKEFNSKWNNSIN